MDLFEFIRKSPTSYHAAAVMAELLTAAGAVELSEREKWNPEYGKPYFCQAQ